ncbi:MAG: DUF1540 domain-containing protein [Micromonosporaceae bacterium]|jgi:hypothetical protein
MTELLEMPQVVECTVTQCGYNHNGCRAAAITIGGESAQCATFIDTPSKGGVTEALGRVGACQRADCRHNLDLECHAPAIRVASGQDVADCQTYDPR